MESSKKKKILILCTGNSCRSQMAEGFFRKSGWHSFSAGTKPESELNHFAINVMSELGIDISHHKTQSVDEYLDCNFYLVATVCDNARKSCPVFTGSCKYHIHHGFEDPAYAKGSDKEIMSVYRQVRDDIHIWMRKISRAY